MMTASDHKDVIAEFTQYLNSAIRHAEQAGLIVEVEIWYPGDLLDEGEPPQYTEVHARVFKEEK